MAEQQDNQQNTSVEENIDEENLALHPLENEWSFWYDRRQNNNKRTRGEKDQYESNLIHVGAFATVEDFWRYFNHMAKPSQLGNNANYHLFKGDIKPMWEDHSNVNGGKWVINLKGNQREHLDIFWESVVLSIVGETLDAGDNITGCVCSRRKAADRIAIWNRDKNDEVTILMLGHSLKKLLEQNAPKGKLLLTYQNHEDSMKSGASYSNPERYTLTIVG
jgi:translation initiation factor 4E